MRVLDAPVKGARLLGRREITKRNGDVMRLLDVYTEHGAREYTLGKDCDPATVPDPAGGDTLVDIDGIAVMYPAEDAQKNRLRDGWGRECYQEPRLIAKAVTLAGAKASGALKVA